MMLRALAELAESEGLLADTSYEPKPLDFFVHLGAGGKFIDFVAAPREAPGKDAKGRPRGVPKPPLRWIPRRSDRTSGDLAEFLVDKSEYVFGLDPKGVGKGDGTRNIRLTRLRALFLERVRSSSAALPGNEALAAVVKFLERDVPAKVRSVLTNPGNLKPEQLARCLIAFVYEPDGGNQCVHEGSAVRSYFRGLLESPEGKSRGQCLVTGANDAVLTRLHAKPKGIPPLGTTKGGVPLTTVNQESFRSYRLDEFGGAPISERANVAIDTALTRLLDPMYPGADGSPLPSRRVTISKDSVLVYWTGREAAVDFFAGIEDRDPQEVAALLQSPYRGWTPPLEDPTAFYAVILSGKQGRAIVRSFIETTVREVAANVERFRAETCVERPYGKGAGGFSLRDFRKALASRGELDELPPAFAAAFYLSAVLGRRYPRAILETVLRRNRAALLPLKPNGSLDPWPLAARSSLLKAWFIRNRGKEISVALNPSRTDVAYRLGRLLATLDMLQADALGQVNASLVDRFFGSASSTPAAVFPVLIRRSTSHLGKLKREKPGLAVVRERLIQDICSSVDAFPKTLGLEDQGLFSIGFYHQRQDFFTKKGKN